MMPREASRPLWRSCVLAIPRAMPLIPPPAEAGPRLSTPGVTVWFSRVLREYLCGGGAGMSVSSVILGVLCRLVLRWNRLG